MVRSRAHWLTLIALSFVTGCASTHPVLVSNPIFIPSTNREPLWEQTVDVIHSYHFPIAREDQLEGVIETDYLVGAGVLEPWHRDSNGLDERLESSLQSIRRHVVVNIVPAENGYLIGVEAWKDLEDAPGINANSPGAASFQESTPLERNLDRVVGPSTQTGWIPLGRDFRLEQAILGSLHRRFARDSLSTGCVPQPL